MNIPENLKYTKDHEWIRVEGNAGYIGITEYAQGELGDVIFVELPAIGKKFQHGEIFGTIEAVKTVSDLYSPIGGEIMEVNKAVQETPEIVNKDPYGKGWMVKVELSNAAEVDGLLSADQYKELIGK